MSRSYRKPYIKDNGLSTQEYWKPIRRTWKMFLNQNYMDPDINFPSPKSLINDWDYCDYIFTPVRRISSRYNQWENKQIEKYSIK